MWYFLWNRLLYYVCLAVLPPLPKIECVDLMRCLHKRGLLFYNILKNRTQTMSSSPCSLLCYLGAFPNILATQDTLHAAARGLSVHKLSRYCFPLLLHFSGACNHRKIQAQSLCASCPTKKSYGTIPWDVSAKFTDDISRWDSCLQYTKIKVCMS